MKIKKIIPILLSQIPLQERIDLDLKDIPTKTMFDYVLFIKQFDISLLYWLGCKKYIMAISKTIFMKTKRLDELTFLYEEYGNNHYESIFTLPKSQMLLNHITKLKFNYTGNYSLFPNLSIYVKNIKYLSINFYCNSNNHKNVVKFFEDLIEFISVQNNLEYFIINIKYLSRIRYMEKWRGLFFKLSESHSIKYIMIKGCIDGEQTDLNFLSNCSNLEELHLDSMIIDYDQLVCLKNIYLPKLFSFSLLDCYFISPKSNYDYQTNLCLIYITAFLMNHGNTLKELKIILRLGTVKQNNLKSILDNLSLYCQNLTLIGLKLEHIFGYGYVGYGKKVDEILNEFKSFCNNCPNLQKIILFSSNFHRFNLPKELLLIFIRSLPKTLKSLSFKGIIEFDHLKEIIKNYIDNLNNLDFYYYACVNVLERHIDEMTKNRKLKLRYDKKQISIDSTSTCRYFLDFNYPWLASNTMDSKVFNL
ncbi:unnamed protein product [Rhizophagus irregularis]|nr:unnamed protein product [Rhizophagus irregularis]